MNTYKPRLDEDLHYQLNTDPGAPLEVALNHAHRFDEHLAYETYLYHCQSETLTYVSEEEFQQLLQEKEFNSRLPRGYGSLDQPAFGVIEAVDDERRLARKVRKELECGGYEGVRFYADRWWVFDNGWKSYTPDVFRNEVLYGMVKHQLERLARDVGPGKKIVVRKVNCSLLAAVEMALRDAVKFDSPVPGFITQKNDKEYLCFLNGIVEVGTTQLIPYTADYFTTSTFPHEFHYTDAEPNELLTMFRSSGLREDEVNLLQEYVGLCFTTLTYFERGLMFIGPPRSGKGTLLKVIRHLLGADNTASKALHEFGERFSLDTLPGKLVLGFPDERETKSQATKRGISSILKIIAGDAVNVEKKRMDNETLELVCKVIVISNYLPDLPDESGALQARFAIVESREDFVGREDRQLYDRIIAEKQEVISWALRGLQRLINRGEFALPDNGIAREYALQNAPIKTFLTECCLPGGSVTKDALYAGYQEFMEQNGQHPLDVRQFYKELKNANSDWKQTRPTIDKQRVYVIEGITLENMSCET